MASVCDAPPSLPRTPRRRHTAAAFETLPPPPSQAYSLGAASLHFDISVGLTASFATGTAGGTAGSTTDAASEALALSPSAPIAASARRELLAKLLGDLAGYTQLPALR